MKTSTKTSTSTTSITPKKNTLTKVVLPFFAGLLIGLVLLFAGIIVYSGYISSELGSEDSDISDEETDGSEAEGVDEDTEDEEADDEEAEVDVVPGFPTGTKRVAYMKDNDIWIVNHDGTDKYQITSDGNGDTVRYGPLDWKASNILSYVKCTGSCKIYTRSLPSGAETVAITPPPFTQFIDTFSWSHSGTDVAYMVRKADNSAVLILNKSGAETTLKSYGIIPGRGIGDDDGESLEFTADDSKVLVYISFVETDPYTLVFRTSDGSTLLTLATGRFPTFDGNNALYYKDSTAHKIMHRDLSAGASTVNLSTFNGFYLKTSPSRNFISFYEVPGNAELGYHDVAGSPATITPAAYFADWLTDTHLIALKSFVYPDVGLLGTNALLKVKRTDGTKITLDSGEVSSFSIED